MLRPRHVASTFVLAIALGACSGSAASPAGGASTAAPAATGAAASVPAASVESGGGGGSGGLGAAGALCSTFTTDEVKAFVGSPSRVTDTTNPTACVWSADNEATITVVKGDEVICEAEKAAVQGFGKGTFDGDYFAGPSSTGASVAGFQQGSFCYEVRVDPTEKAPDAAALLTFLKTFVQRAG
ncbi:MAG TPA: hypothetical protein VF484_01355 [Candidatus Limnocylindrales bacterium]